MSNLADEVEAGGGTDEACPDCNGNGWYSGEELVCCQRAEWECGGRGCIGPAQVQTQVQCERCAAIGRAVDDDLLVEEPK